MMNEKKCLPCNEYRTRVCTMSGCSTCINNTDDIRRCITCKFATYKKIGKQPCKSNCNYYRKEV